MVQLHGQRTFEGHSEETWFVLRFPSFPTLPSAFYDDDGDDEDVVGVLFVVVFLVFVPLFAFRLLQMPAICLDSVGGSQVSVFFVAAARSDVRVRIEWMDILLDRKIFTSIDWLVRSFVRSHVQNVNASHGNTTQFESTGQARSNVARSRRKGNGRSK